MTQRVSALALQESQRRRLQREGDPRRPEQSTGAVRRARTLRVHCISGSAARTTPGPIPSVDVTLRVQEGPRYFINRITFVGNTTTRDQVIRRELRVYEGGVFNSEALKMSIRRLNQLGYFKPLEDQKHIQVDKTPNEPDKVDLTLKLEEQNRNQLSFGAGMSADLRRSSSTRRTRRRIFWARAKRCRSTSRPARAATTIRRRSPSRMCSTGRSRWARACSPARRSTSCIRRIRSTAKCAKARRITLGHAAPRVQPPVQQLHLRDHRQRRRARR